MVSISYGADIGGLAAARDSGLQTGGYAPKGYRTVYGANERLKKLGLVEMDSPNYRIRTFANVEHSDGTIRLCHNFSSVGEVLTLQAIQKYKKPYIDIDLKNPPFVLDVYDFLINNSIEVLNVAGNCGNSREESGRIFNEVRCYLNKVFKFYFA